MADKTRLAEQIAATKKSLEQRPTWMQRISGFEGYRYQGEGNAKESGGSDQNHSTGEKSVEDC